MPLWRGSRRRRFDPRAAQALRPPAARRQHYGRTCADKCHSARADHPQRRAEWGTGCVRRAGTIADAPPARGVSFSQRARPLASGRRRHDDRSAPRRRRSSASVSSHLDSVGPDHRPAAQCRAGASVGEDINFDDGTIRWRAEHDILRRTSVVPAARATLEELRRFRTVLPGVGEAPLFPHPKQMRHGGGPITRPLAAYWLRRAYEASGAPKPAGSLWHAFRRLWATERKQLPVKDVAAAGRWKDITTLLECYQQPDDVTLRAVVDYLPPQTKAATPRFQARGRSQKFLTH